MRKRPLALFFCSLLFLYFPLELFFRWSQQGRGEIFDFVLSVVLPLTLMAGLIRVSKVGWYTLIAMVALWGVRDLYEYYHSEGMGVGPLLVHISIYCLSMGYFINPRVRHLYFDPKLRWWRTKPRYETHVPFIMASEAEWQYPILRNISEGGCFIETSHLLNVNDSIDIAIPLPVPLSVSVIKTKGEVRWVSTNPVRHGMGVQFIDAPPLHTKAIREYVRRQL
jgi:hypothetical protein